MPDISQNAIAATNGTGNAIELTGGSNTCTANITQINSVPFPSAGALSNRNLIINGAMNVAQRATSAAGTGYKTVDRFTSQGSGSQAFTQSQDTDVPANQGFSKSLKFDCTTALASPAAGNYLAITYRIEAQDLQCIANGTSSAKKLTLSFWVKSPKTGNHAIGLYKNDNTGRQNTKTYSVSAADTWEKKTITFDGDTSGGGIANDNGQGLQLDWMLMTGTDFTSVDSSSWVNYSDAAWAYGHAVNCMDNTANNFYLTGVQLEIGEYATDFEFRPIKVERGLCERYFMRVGFFTIFGSGGGFNTSVWNHAAVPIQGMREVATVTRVGNIYSSALTSSTIGILACNSDPWCQYLYGYNNGGTYGGCGAECTLESEL